jgi:predicted phosphodiesterase
LRAKDPANCLVAFVTTIETIEIRQFRNGVPQTLASDYGYLPSGDNTIEVQAYGPRITVVLNGMKAVSCDNAPTEPGRCGLMAAASADLDLGSFQVWKDVPPAEMAAPRILKTAYLLGVTGNSARILWETLTPMEGRVGFGLTAGSLSETVKHEGETFMHDITITGLKPGTKYFFTARSGDLSAGEGSFTTDPGPGVPFRVGVLSDTHYTDFTKAVTERLMARDPHMAILSGDYLAQGEEADQWDAFFFRPASEFLRNVPTYIAAGNHDASGRHWSRRYLPYAKDTDHGARYFTFHYGNAQFIALTHYDTPLTPGSPQYNWLIEQLNSEAWKSARWRFVYYHQPPYSLGWKRWETGGDLDIRTHILPLLEKHGTTMVLSGHTHSHERGYLNGVVHIINGSIGKGEDWGRNYPFMQYFRVMPHYSVMDINDDTLTFTAYNMNNAILDRFVLEHGKPFDLAVGPTVVKGPVDGVVGDQEVTLKCPELGQTPVRYRVVLDERRSEDGFWTPSEQTFPADQEAKLTVKFPAPGKFTVKCQVLTADMLRPGQWVDAGVVNIKAAE